MLLCRVEGNVVATRKHPSLEGWRLVICQPINREGEPEGSPQIAIDPHGAGISERVIISSDGLGDAPAGRRRQESRAMDLCIVESRCDA